MRSSTRTRKQPRRTAARGPASKASRAGEGRYWSARVTRTSNALDLERGVFVRGSPREIAASLKRSAQRSRRRKAAPYASAMSMLNFYLNRAGRNLGARQKARLERAKKELRKLFGRD
jgi:Protein of unknown function (DUF3175)